MTDSASTRNPNRGRTRAPYHRVMRTLLAGVALATILLASVAAASAFSSTAGAVTGEFRIVYRTVHLKTRGGRPEVYSVLPSGQGRHLLARGAEQPAWSPDHTRIAFAAGGLVRRKGIWVMNADGSAQRRLTTRSDDHDPTWSPDGRRIAFTGVSSPSGSDLWVVPAAGGKARPLLRTPQANEGAPDWSPDGRRIALESTRGGPPGKIWVLTLASGQARRLTGGWRDSFSPDWAPDGRRLAYVTRARNGWRIAVMDVARRRVKLLQTGTPLSVDDPAWSPDGRRVAFQRGGQVLTMRADGSDRRYVTRAAWGTNDGPDW
jgi:dipeptidyl aminopeptidase/acylaminoacyl peptidase